MKILIIDMTYNFLILGDAHIPDRESKLAYRISEKIKEICNNFETKTFDKVYYTGDFTDSDDLFNFLTSIIATQDDLNIVIGNMDYFSRTEGKLKEFIRHRQFIKKYKIKSQKIKIGMIHGQSIRPRGDPEKLRIKAKEIGVNILLSGHTHAHDIFFSKKHSKYLLINPGSCTGAWSFHATKTPSFIHFILDETITIRLYILKGARFQMEECAFIFEKGEFKKRN